MSKATRYAILGGADGQSAMPKQYARVYMDALPLLLPLPLSLSVLLLLSVLLSVLLSQLLPLSKAALAYAEGAHHA